MSDNSSAPSTIARLLVEGFVIVVSILLAFGIEAWWDGRQAQEELDSLVELLEADIEQNLAELRAQREAALEAVRGMTGLLATMHGAGNPSPDSLRVLIASTLEGADYQITSAAYDAGLGTEAWTLFPTDIKLRLAEFARASQAPNVALRTESYNAILQSLARHGGLAAFLPVSLLEAVGLPSNTRQGNLDGLLSDPEFEAAVTGHWATERNLAMDFERWIRELEAIRDALTELRTGAEPESTADTMDAVSAETEGS